MGKLVLTRRAGESVIVREANGDEWTVTVLKHRGIFKPNCVDLIIEGNPFADIGVTLRPGQSYAFAGGSLEMRPARCPSQAILAFDFPRDVTILRTEIA
jgi:sRNA-binding carbon storage regulator CsrA